MKLVILLSLVIFLVLGILFSVCMYGYLQELKHLPTIFFNSQGSEDNPTDDRVYYVVFYVSLFINLLTLSSCAITIIL